MKLSTRARYALRMMVVFARNGGDRSKLVSLNDVSEQATVSRRYLEQIVIGLKEHGLIRGKSGKGGGYRLARRPEDITLNEIVESTIGPINIVECVLNPDACLKSDFCECRSLYGLINRRITSVLDTLVLADLVDGDRLGRALALLEDGEAEAPCPEVP